MSSRKSHQAISSYFPYEGKQRRLELGKIWVDDKLNIDDLKSQADARDFDRTWGVPVKARSSLGRQGYGKTIDRKTMTLARLPKLTSRYGFIVDGNEYQVDHLFRLKSGRLLTSSEQRRPGIGVQPCSGTCRKPVLY